MVEKTIRITRLLTIYLLISCTSFAQIEKIYVSPKTVAISSQAQFVDSLKFIPLVSNEKEEMGQYSVVMPTRDFFLAIDYPAKGIYIYTKEGVLLKQISFKRLGRGFYPRYQNSSNQIVFMGNNQNYALTPRDQIRIEQDRNNRRNRKYFKKYVIELEDSMFAIKKASLNDYDILDAQQLYDDYYIQSSIKTSPLYKDTLGYELILYKEDKPVKTFFPYNRRSAPRFLYATESIVVSECNRPDERYLMRPFCDTIYKMVQDSIFPVYQLVLPLENTLPSSFYTQPFRNKTERDNFQQNNGWMLHQILSFYENNRYIAFNISFNRYYEGYIYDKQTSQLYNNKNIKADSTQFNLQLLSSYNSVRVKNKYYILKPAGELIDFFK